MRSRRRNRRTKGSRQSLGSLPNFYLFGQTSRRNVASVHSGEAAFVACARPVDFRVSLARRVCLLWYEALCERVLLQLAHDLLRLLGDG